MHIASTHRPTFKHEKLLDMSVSIKGLRTFLVWNTCLMAPSLEMVYFNLVFEMVSEHGLVVLAMEAMLKDGLAGDLTKEESAT